VSGGGAASTQAIRSVVVHTHRDPGVTREVVQILVELAGRHGVELRFDEDETAKHGLGDAAASSLRVNSRNGSDSDLCIVLGGDGTTLRTLRAYARTGVPVFAINCGRVGFLATVDRDRAREGLERALAGDFEVIPLPSLTLGEGSGDQFAVNDVSFQRGAHMNVAHLAYSLAGEQVARAPCDGLIASTPVGSTAYNLSVGGPILAWDVRAFVVSMVAPHALALRSLVAAPEDVLEVRNEGSEQVTIVLDGMHTGALAPGEAARVRFQPDVVGLAQLPGSSFYARYREKLRLLTG
jgi:NAD+ kinase